MDKALKLGQISATGSFQLFIGKVLSTVVLAVGTIVLTILITPTDYGLYAVALVPSSIFLIFQDWGVGSAMIKYSAGCRTENQEGDLRGIVISGLTFEFATGTILAVFALLTAGFIASSIFAKPESGFLIGICSVTILSTALIGAFTNIFVGFERMDLFVYTMICQAATQSVLTILLVFLGFGAFGAVVGYTLSSVASTVFVMALFYVKIFRKLGHSRQNWSNSYHTLKKLLRFGTPLAVASILSNVLYVLYPLFVAAYYTETTMGNFKVATNFSVLLDFFTLPISTVLFPMFSKLDSQNELSTLKTVFKTSAKFAAIFIAPATLAMIVLSSPLIGTLYGGKFSSSATLLSLLVLSNLMVVFGNLSVPNLFQAMGATKLRMKLSLLTLFIGLSAIFVLMPIMGLYGIIIASVIDGAPSTLIGLYLAWKRYGTTIDALASVKILGASAFAAGVTYLFLTVFLGAEWLRLGAGLIVFLVLYLITAPLIGAVNRTDINNLRSMFSELGVISRLLEVPLRILSALVRK